jgi:D-alanine-D-alanine ligase
MSSLDKSINVNDYGKVAVLMGGWSAEREVSLMSVKQVFKALLESGVDAHPIDVDRDLISTLAKNKFDRAFIVLHGRGGEDGQVQGALQFAQLPYTGSGILSSSLAMNKQKSKEICKAGGFNTPHWKMAISWQACESAAKVLGYPLVVKPILEGSSIGVAIVHSEASLKQAWTEAARYGEVMVEQFIDGQEVTVSILNGKALPLVSMSTDREFYDYKAKYLDDNTQYQCPCGLPDNIEIQVRGLALGIFSILGAHGWGRVDFILDKDNKPYFIELNTVPGMTNHSLVPMAAAQIGIDFKTLCIKVLDSSFGERK